MDRAALVVSGAEPERIRPVFIYGQLLDPAIRARVLGAEHGVTRADMPSHGARATDCPSPPFSVPTAGDLSGLLLEDLSQEARARLDFYMQVQGLTRSRGEVLDGQGVRACEYFSADEAAPAAQPWRYQDWPAPCRAVTQQAADEIMRDFGQRPVPAVRARLDMIQQRAASRVRGAAAKYPARLRADWGPGAVRESDHRQPYGGFFTVEESTLSFRRFDGTMSPPVDRAGFVGGDAALVLPYDPARDRVLLIEQFRFGPWLRRDPRPWLLEPIAGRVDALETPEDCARREAREEAGLDLNRLIRAPEYYPSPGVDTEFFYTFLGLADLSGRDRMIGGLASEHEDIRLHVVGFDALMGLVSSGEVTNGPLVLLALWLAQNRSELRARA